jgi:replicative superfamily II helicase
MAPVLAKSDANVVVSAPTGAGKTALFEMALVRLLFDPDRAHTGAARKAVYISPTKALCEERFQDWSTRLAKMDPTLKVALVTGDADAGQASSCDIASADVIVTTPEKWDGSTRNCDSESLIRSVNLLMIDEVHHLGDKSSGSTLEAVLCRMMKTQRVAVGDGNGDEAGFRSDMRSDMRIVAVSATLPNIADIATFIEAEGHAYSFDSSYRAVPIEVHVSDQGSVETNQFMFDQGLSKDVPDILRKFSNDRPSIVFCHIRKDTEHLAESLAREYATEEQKAELSKTAEGTKVKALRICLLSGIAYHHAGMEVQDRHLVEKAFSEGHLRCICATSTLAMGVNLPAHLVVIRGTNAWRGADSGYQDIDPGTLLQMMGRAGRPGFDSSGTAVIMTDSKSKTRYESLSSGLKTLESRLLGRLVETLNIEVSQRVITDVGQAIDWVKGTFFFGRVRKNPVFYGMQGKSEEQQDAYLRHKCLGSLEELHRAGIIELQEDGLGIKPLVGCHVMSKHMIAFDDMKAIIDLPHDAGPLQLLQMLSKVEGLHRPVRRDEKKQLKEANKVIKYRLEGAPSKISIQTSSQKAFVLLQCAIGQIFIENSTLRQEMSHMVDQASRIIAACEVFSIDGSRHGQVALQSLLLGRSLSTSLWGANDGVLNQLRGVGHKNTAKLTLAGIRNFADIMSSSSNQIEQACGQRSPFGQELRMAAKRIIDSTLSLSISIDGLDDDGKPTVLSCRLEEQPDRHSQSQSVVSYTLAVHTDRPGGLLMNRSIDQAGEHCISCPDKWGRLYVRIVGNLVGLDQQLSVDGNDAIQASSFTLSPKATKVAKVAKPKIGAKSKENGSSAYPKRRPDNKNPKRGTRILKAMVEGVEDYRVSKNKRAAPFRKQDIQSNTSSGLCINLCEDEDMEQPVVSPSPPPPTNSHRSSTSATNHRVGGGSFRNWREQKRRYEDVEQRNSRTSEIDSEPRSLGTMSWKVEQREQAQLQKRAFTSPKENPFASFKFDPNNAERSLAFLSSCSSTTASTLARSSNGHKAPRLTKRFSRGGNYKRSGGSTSRKRKHFTGLPLPPQELLRQKAYEQQMLAKTNPPFHSPCTSMPSLEPIFPFSQPPPFSTSANTTSIIPSMFQQVPSSAYHGMKTVAYGQEAYEYPYSRLSLSQPSPYAPPGIGGAYSHYNHAGADPNDTMVDPNARLGSCFPHHSSPGFAESSPHFDQASFGINMKVGGHEETVPFCADSVAIQSLLPYQGGIPSSQPMPLHNPYNQTQLQPQGNIDGEKAMDDKEFESAFM